MRHGPGSLGCFSYLCIVKENNMLKLLGNSKNELPAEINNPFNMENIEGIHLHCTKKLFDDGFNFWGNVVFKNGDTEGTQEFKAESLGDLFVKIHGFCERLGAVTRYK